MEAPGDGLLVMAGRLVNKIRMSVEQGCNQQLLVVISGCNGLSKNLVACTRYLSTSGDPAQQPNMRNSHDSLTVMTCGSNVYSPVFYSLSLRVQ